MLIKLKGLFPVKLKTYLKKFKKFNAYHELDKKLLKYINYQNGFYIDCGANDGVNQSTTWYFEKFLNWQGIAFEPSKKQFLKLNQIRNCICKNEALGSMNKKIEFCDVISGPTMMSGLKNEAFEKNLELINNTIIKLPNDNINLALNLAIEFLNNNKFIDARIKNQIILND